MLFGGTFGQSAQQDETWIHMLGYVGKKFSQQVPDSIRADADDYALRCRARALVALEVVAVGEYRSRGCSHHFGIVEHRLAEIGARD